MWKMTVNTFWDPDDFHWITLQLTSVCLNLRQKQLPLCRRSVPWMFQESLISIIIVLFVCHWLTVRQTLCFKHELAIQCVTAHHNLWTIPLSVCMKNTVRYFSGRWIKQMNNSQCCWIFWHIKWATHPLFHISSLIVHLVITLFCAPPCLMQLSPQTLSQAAVTHCIHSQDK